LAKTTRRRSLPAEGGESFYAAIEQLRAGAPHPFRIDEATLEEFFMNLCDDRAQASAVK